MHWFESNPPQLAYNCQLQAVPHCFVVQVIGMTYYMQQRIKHY